MEHLLSSTTSVAKAVARHAEQRAKAALNDVTTAHAELVAADAAVAESRDRRAAAGPALSRAIGAALAVVAALLGAGEADLVADRIEQAEVVGSADRVVDAVDGEQVGDRGGHWPAFLPMPTDRLTVYIVSSDGYFVERMTVPTMAALQRTIGIYLKTIGYDDL